MEDARALWAARNDEDLLDAAQRLAEFTEEGERILRAELQRRGLPQPEPPIGYCSNCRRSIARNHPGDECGQCGEPLRQDILRALGAPTPEAELVSVLRTGDPGLIPFAKSLLESEGIEYLVRGEFTSAVGEAELLVHSDDVEGARTLLDGISAVPSEPPDDPEDDA